MILRTDQTELKELICHIGNLILWIKITIISFVYMIIKVIMKLVKTMFILIKIWINKNINIPVVYLDLPSLIFWTKITMKINKNQGIPYN